jgi:hypothetical protein
MSTPTAEIEVDLDAASQQAPENATQQAREPKNGSKKEEILVDAPEKTPVKAEKSGISTEEGIEKLRKELADETVRRQTAEAAAREAAHGEAVAKTEVQKTQLDQIKGAIEQSTQQLDVLESRLEGAYAAQDFKLTAKIQRQMSEISGRLGQLEAGKIALEKAPKPVPRTPDDPVEKLCSGLSPQSASWVRAHPEFARDQTKYRQMIAAHELAVARGHKSDTDGYFKDIEKTLDLAVSSASATSLIETPETDEDPMAQAAQPAAKTPTVAPVSRGNGQANRVRLTADEREMARMMFPDSKDPDREYAQNKFALQREGKLQ